MKSIWNGRKILITGGSGSLGKKLLARTVEGKAKRVKVFSRDEERQFKLKWTYLSKNVDFILGDVRDFNAVLNAVRGCDLVIHAAAFKFLDLGEKQPRECALTNVVGSINVIDACVRCNVKQAIGISTDKPPYARNVYGSTKHI